MTVDLNGVHYPVDIVFRRQKRIVLRFLKNTFKVSAPNRTPLHWIQQQILNHGQGLILKIKQMPSPWTPEGMYVFGRWQSLDALTQMFSLKPVVNIEQLANDLKRLKKVFLPPLLDRVKYWQKLLNIHTVYRISVRNMRSRLGSNSRKTKRLSFALKLIHFSWPTIDAVIVHELIHDRHFDHSPRFYQSLLQAYPQYRQEHAKILKGHYE